MGWIQDLRGKNVFIAGSKKNAGKTTFMNYAARKLKDCRLALMSIGIDGEESDGIFANPKPRIMIEENNLFVCSENELAASGTQYEILKAYPFRTALGRPVLARALRRGQAEISGPENNSQLAGLIADTREQGAETVFVDGAADRVTHSATIGNAVLAYVARIEPENISSVISSLNILAASSECGLWNEEEPAKACSIRLPGAVTESRAERAVSEYFASLRKTGMALPENAIPGMPHASRPALIADNPACIFLSWQAWRRLAAKCDIFFLSKTSSILLIINLYNVDKADFERRFCSAGKCKVIYNPYAG